MSIPSTITRYGAPQSPDRLTCTCRLPSFVAHNCMLQEQEKTRIFRTTICTPHAAVPTIQAPGHLLTMRHWSSINHHQMHLTISCFDLVYILSDTCLDIETTSNNITHMPSTTELITATLPCKCSAYHLVPLAKQHLLATSKRTTSTQGTGVATHCKQQDHTSHKEYINKDGASIHHQQLGMQP